MEEIWQVTSVNSNYAVSTTGKVRNVHTLKELKIQEHKNGYLTVHLYNTTRKVYYVHRLVALTFLPNPLTKTEVNHIDGNKKNNNLLNLEWCTRSENGKHAYKVGLAKPHKNLAKIGRTQLNYINSKPELRAKALSRAAEVNKGKSQHEYIMNSSNQFKPLYCIELHKLFLTAKRVEEKLGINRGAIQKAMAKGYKTCGGYHWKYITNHRFNNYSK